jgi:hypothetical protein
MGFRQLIKDLAEVWRIEMDKRREQKALHRIEYAFTSGGRKYYCYEDISNLPYQRARAALTCYNEVEMRCSREFLLRWTKAMDNVLRAKEIDIFKVNELNGILKDRLTLTADLDLCYRLAAIVYFDKTEKPEVYEPEYAAKKIERWKKDQSVADFFSQKPLKELIPYLTNAVGNFDMFFQLNMQLNQLHNDLTRLIGSTDNKAHTTNGNKS